MGRITKKSSDKRKSRTKLHRHDRYYDFRDFRDDYFDQLPERHERRERRPDRYNHDHHDRHRRVEYLPMPRPPRRFRVKRLFSRIYHWDDWLGYRASNFSGKFSEIFFLACKWAIVKTTTEGSDNAVWEVHKVVLTRDPRLGFGIAISGGTDNPHFINDNSIAISDVLTAGPAYGKLKNNDRVVSVNRISLENVDQDTAITLLKQSQNKVYLEIKRHVVVDETKPLNITLHRRSKKDDFGVILGCRYFVKKITGNSIAAHEGGLKEGDAVLKVNDTNMDAVSLNEANKLIEKTKDQLRLVITKKLNLDHKRQNSNSVREDELAFSTLKRQSDINNVNIYRPFPRADDNVNDNANYKQSLINSHASLPNINYPPETIQGHQPSQPQTSIHHLSPITSPNGPAQNTSSGRLYSYSISQESTAPPRPPLPLDPSGIAPRPQTPTRDPLRSDDYYVPHPSEQQQGIYPGHRYDPHGYHGEVYGDQPDQWLSGQQSLSSGDVVPDVGLSRREHQERYIEKRADIRLDPRTVSYVKDQNMGLGLRLAGGNATGIFIAHVQEDSAAEREGLAEGDQILQANGLEITGLTREEAVSRLMDLKGQVTITVQYRKEEFDRIMASREAGDSFYIRTHFNYSPPHDADAGELGFAVGNIFHVKDTLYRGIVGSWIAIRLEHNTEEKQKGLIPNLSRATMLAAEANQNGNNNNNSSDKENSLRARGGSLFRRKSGRRTKSLGRDHWEDVIFSTQTTKFRAYERVQFKLGSFVRPVIIFGPMADIARERLVKTNSLFESLQDNSSEDDEKHENPGIIRMSAVRDAIKRDRHCVMDVTPHAVDHLNYVGFYPIVIFIKSEKQMVKDSREKYGKPTKNTKKLMEQGAKLEKMYPHLFTAIVQDPGLDNLYGLLYETIASQQGLRIWMADRKPDDEVNDDYLFPMANRLSDTTSPESELDLSRPVNEIDAPNRHKLARSSSDPNVAVVENFQGHDHRLRDEGGFYPPGGSLPGHYSPDKRSPEQLMRDDNYYQKGNRYYSDSDYNQGPAENRYYPSYYGDNPPPPTDKRPHNRANIDPYATITPAERLRGRVGSEDAYPTSHQPQQQYNAGYSDYRDPYKERPAPANQTSPHRRVPQPGEPGHNDSSSHTGSGSSDSYSKHINRPENKNDDSKIREIFTPSSLTTGPTSGSHDPYRFTRSTAHPVNTSNVDKAKLSDFSARYRKDDQNRSNKILPNKPIPPSKPSNVQRREPPPVPPKTYTLAERGVRDPADDYKLRNNNYENPTNRTGPMRGGDTYYVAQQDRFDGTLTYPTGPYEQYAQAPPYQSNHTEHRSRENLYDVPPIRNDDYSRKTDYAMAAQVEMDKSNYSSHHGNASGMMSSPDNYNNRPSSSSGNHGYGSAPGYGSSTYRPSSGYAAPFDRNNSAYPKDSGFHSPIDRPSSELSDNIQSSPTQEVTRLCSDFDIYKRLLSPKSFTSNLPELSFTFNETDGEINGYGHVTGENGYPESSTDFLPQQQRNGDVSAYRNPGVTSFRQNEPRHRVTPQKMYELSTNEMPRTPTQSPSPPLPPPPSGQFPEAHDQLETHAWQNNFPLDDQDEDLSTDTDGATSTSVSTPDTVIAVNGFAQDNTDEIDGHTVVASERGMFDHTGGILESKDTGVSIYIPPGALPDTGVKQEIYFKVCKDSNILPPLDKDKGETLLSPLVMCGPHGMTFNKPVELRLPHCAAVNPESWSFALKSSDSPTGHPTQWHNMNLAGVDGITQGKVGASSVSVLVDHF